MFEKVVKKITKEIVKKVTYWDCGNPGCSTRHKSEKNSIACTMSRGWHYPCHCNSNHRHRTAESRDKCIDRHHEIHIRWVLAVRAVISGASYAKAGKTVGLSRDRTRQILRKVIRMILNFKEFANVKLNYDCYDVRNIQKDSELWLYRINFLANRWGIDD